MILENLRKAGVQNTKKSERLKFDTSRHLCRASGYTPIGNYAEADGKTRRAAISIGPEHGTVGPLQVKEAAKEAVKGVGFDMLIVCGFAFDPHVSEEAKRYGKLNVIASQNEPGPGDGQRTLEEDRSRKPLHVSSANRISLSRNKRMERSSPR